MVFYVRDITTPKETTPENPKVTEFKLSAGIIHRVEVIFPRGCAGLLHVTIWHGGHQLYPSTQGQDFSGDGETISFNDYYQLKSEVNLLKIKTWNEDTVFSHTVTVRLGILKEEEVNPYALMKDFIEIMKKLVGI